MFPGTGLFPPSWPRSAARAADHARSGISSVLTSGSPMEYLLSSLALTVFVGILALLAQWSRKSRRAEISLLIVLVFTSLLLLATGSLLGVIWVSGQMPPEVYPQQLLAVTVVPVTMAGLIGLALCVPTLLKIVGRRPSGEFWTDPPIFLALWLFSTVLLANNLIG